MMVVVLVLVVLVLTTDGRGEIPGTSLTSKLCKTEAVAVLLTPLMFLVI